MVTVLKLLILEFNGKYLSHLLRVMIIQILLMRLWKISK